MPAPPKDASRLRVAQLNRRTGADIALSLDEGARADLAQALGLIDLPAARLEGRLSPEEGEGWRLDARLSADVVQACIITLAPVPSHVDEAIRRIYSPHATRSEDDEAGEVEMADDEIEPLGQSIDLAAVLAEELSLALPLYPRAPGAALGAASAEEEAEGGETRRPFAGLDQLIAARSDD